MWNAEARSLTRIWAIRDRDIGANVGEDCVTFATEAVVLAAGAIVVVQSVRGFGICAICVNSAFTADYQAIFGTANEAVSA